MVNTSEQENAFGRYHINHYILQHPEIILGDEIKQGKNQYGNAHQTVWQNGNINDIGEKLAATIRDGIHNHFNREVLLYQLQKKPLQRTGN